MSSVMQAITSAIGEQINEFCGLRIGRLAAIANIGDTTITMERTYGLPDSGKIGIDNAVYYYTGNTDGTLAGLYYLNGAVQVPGVAIVHIAGTAVLDLSQSYSSLDMARQSVILATADADDLNVIGRNYGVLRIPTLKGDDLYRAVIQAMAYNPRATIYGLTIALDALVGAGNYTIYEDLVNSPCTVFVQLAANLFLNTAAQGQTYLRGPQVLPAVSGDISYTPPTMTFPYAHVTGIRIPDDNLQDACTAALPSAYVAPTRYAGESARHPWVFGNSTQPEASNVQVQSGNGGASVWIDGYEGTYTYVPQALPISDMRFNVLFGYNAVAPNVTNEGVVTTQAILHDGAIQVQWGVNGDSPTTAQIMLYLSSGQESVFTITYGTFYEIEIRKQGQTYVDLYVDGQRVARYPYSAFPASSAAASVQFGNQNTSSNTAFPQLRALGYASHTAQDFWLASGATASASTSTPRSVTLSIASVTDDVGKQLRLHNSAVNNAHGGNNNGVFDVTSVSGSSFTVTGKGATGQTDGVNHTRLVAINTPDAFTYPDDLGKTVTITGSVLGNNGVYIIGALRDPNTLVDLSASATVLTQYTNVCELVGAIFVAESNIVYTLTPNFVTESGIDWELSDASSKSGTSPVVINPRQPLPYASGVYEVDVSNVLSAQVLDTNDVVNAIESAGPPATYKYWPFYVTDPFNFVEVYLQQLVAAGVQVVFTID